MKIAVLGPSPIPFVIGGAENLTWGLCDAINKYTDHVAEIIKVPVREDNFWNLIDSYYKFFKLDLNHFDIVISMKYPSWMIPHKKIICYMMHTLRGLYDSYRHFGLSEEVKAGCAPIDELLAFMNSNQEFSKLDEFFDRLFKLRDNASIPAGYFSFPAPFIRKIIHYLDSCAMNRSAIKKFAVLSDTVKNRKDYFPENVEIQTIYPPTTIKSTKFGDYNYVFMISRLDAPKRIDLLIKAFKYVKNDVQLLIAGTGPEKEKLETLAAGDDRIKFLGFVRDEDVDELYSNALCVPYFPFEEDYGYITIETFQRKKPVITTVDAGGPTEFVKNDETGFVVPVDERAIAEKIDYLFENKNIARQLGENGYNIVQDITWPKAVNDLLDFSKVSKKKKITVTSTFSIYPPLGGGQARLFNLYSQLGKNDYEVEIVCFDHESKNASTRIINDNLTEIIVPKSAEHAKKELEIEKKAKIQITDIAMIQLSVMTPEYGLKLKESISDSDFIVISHPYLYEEAKKMLKGKKIIYEAHNVESVMKKNMLPESDVKDYLVSMVFKIEKECCENSDFIIACGEEDKETLSRIYNIQKNKIIIVPNGVDCSKTVFTSISQRIKNKKTFLLSSEKIGIFMGSWHGPNLEACEKIIEMAPKCPDVKFLLIGSQCWYFKDRVLPENVGLLGLVSDEQKNKIFSVADFALNPMLSGSGTNLKMFDYMAAGIPVITTRFGTRGIEDKSNFILAEIDDMPDAVNNFVLDQQNELTKKSRAYVEENFDWNGIAKKFLEMSKMFET